MAEDRLMASVSGVRGTIGKTLTPQVARDFGCAFGKKIGAGKKVVLGRDTRPSGPMVRNAVVAGLLASGVDVIDLGVVTTPGVALMVSKLAADGGVIITASHNPAPYNGIKFLQSAGCGLTATMAGEVNDIWRSGQFALADVDHQGRQSTDQTTGEKHIAAVCENYNVQAIADKRFKVVLDSINGAGCDVTAKLLAKLGCELIHLNSEPTGVFAHEPEPIEANLKSLCDAVRQHAAAVGFAQDPDADRLVLVDQNGTFIGEEYTFALAAAFALTGRKGNLATNLSTSRMIDDVAAAAGVEVVRAPTGEANVVEAMMTEGCILAGEGNGGVIDPRVAPIRNSLVGIAMILQYLAETGQTLSELAAAIPSYVMLKTKMPCPAGAAEVVAAKARETFQCRQGVRFNDADGLRIDLPDGWVSVRASNTEPIMRIMAEAASRPAAQALVDEVRSIADEVIGG